MTAYGGPPPASPTPPGSPGYYTPRPAISFDVFGQAVNLFKMQMGAWLSAMGLCFVIGLVYYAIGVVLIFMPMMATAGSNSGAVQGTGFLVTMLMEMVFGLVGMVLMTTLMGGLFRMAIKQVRGETISFNDMLSAKDVVGPLVAAALLVSLFTFLGSMACYFPAFVVGGVLMFTIPLVVDQRLPAMDAIRQSYNLLKQDWLMATGFYLLASLIGGLGVMACGVGVLFTFPIFILSIGITYANYMTGGVPPVVPGAAPTMPGGYAPTAPGVYTSPTVETPASGGYTPPASYTPAAPTPGYAPPAPQTTTPAQDLSSPHYPTLADNNSPTLRTDDPNNPPPRA